MPPGPRLTLCTRYRSGLPQSADGSGLGTLHQRRLTSSDQYRCGPVNFPNSADAGRPATSIDLATVGSQSLPCEHGVPGAAPIPLVLFAREGGDENWTTSPVHSRHATGITRGKEAGGREGPAAPLRGVKDLRRLPLKQRALEPSPPEITTAISSSTDEV